MLVHYMIPVILHTTQENRLLILMCCELIEKICCIGPSAFRCTVEIWGNYNKTIFGNYDPELPGVKDFTKTKKFVLLGGIFFETS